MATSRTPEQFRRRFKILTDNIEEGVERLVRATAIKIDQTAVLSSPVDTGRFRANWIVSFVTPADGEAAKAGTGVNRGRVVGKAAALEQGRALISTWKLKSGAIFITNNTPYAVFLEQGSSAQAPNGVARKSLLEGVRFARRRVRSLLSGGNGAN